VGATVYGVGSPDFDLEEKYANRLGKMGAKCTSFR